MNAARIDKSERLQPVGGVMTCPTCGKTPYPESILRGIRYACQCGRVGPMAADRKMAGRLFLREPPSQGFKTGDGREYYFSES